MKHASTYRRIAFSPTVCLIALTTLFVPWATYIQLAPGITPVTGLTFTFGAIQLFFMAAKGKVSIDVTIYLFAIYIVTLFLSWFWAFDSENWYNAVFWWFICFLSFAGTVWFVRSPNHIRLIVYFSLAGALIAGMKLQIITDDWGNVLSRRGVAGHNQNFTAYVLSGVILIALVSSTLIRFPTWFNLALPIAIFALLYFHVQLGTRGALISSVAVIALHLSRNFAPRLILRLIPIVALSLSLMVSFGLLEVLFDYMDSFSTRGTGDLSGRTFIWAEAIVYIQQYPFLGIGPGSFPSVNFSGSGAHNFFLTILLETGVLGTVIFTIFFVKFFRLFFKIKNRRMGSYLMGMFSAYWFPLVSSGHWETSPFSWIVVALFICIVQMCETSENTRRGLSGILLRPTRNLNR